MVSKPLQRALKGAGKPPAEAVALASLGPLPADGQTLPIFATLDGAPVAVLALDEYRRLLQAAMDGMAPPRVRSSSASKPSGRPVSTIERDPEVAAYLRELFRQHRTVAELRAACIERFGEARSPSLTRISIFRQRTG